MPLHYEIDGLAVVATVVGGVLGTRMAARPDGGGRSRGWTGEPGVWLAVVTVILLVNQLLMTIYMLRIQHGNPQFIAQYEPSGWFDLAGHNPAVRWLAARWPDPGLLSICLLRVPAFFELPFGLLAYLTVSRWFDQRLYRCLISGPMLWSASVAYTMIFIVIEWLLRTPYTGADVTIRVVSGLVVPAVLGWLLRRRDGRREWHVESAAGLLVFAVSAASLGACVLVLYDTALIYSLGRLSADLPLAAVAVAVLLAARLGARAVPDRAAGPHVNVEAAALWWWFLVFFVAALPVRYALGFGSRWLAVALGAGLAMIACGNALRRVARRFAPIRPVPLAARLGVAVLVAAVCSAPVAVVPARYVEIRVLATVAVFLTMVTILALVFDRLTEPPDRRTIATRVSVRGDRRTSRSDRRDQPSPSVR
jgi:hypothetical protein